MTDGIKIVEYFIFTGFNYSTFIQIFCRSMNILMERKFFKRSFLGVTLGFVFLFGFVFHVSAAENLEKTDMSEILVIGNGSVIRGNVAAARDAAISDALVKGVAQYLALYLGSEKMINNFARLINDVIPKSGEEIENYNILAEEKNDRQYKILVRIKVNEELMEEKLSQMGIILRDVPAIKLLFLVYQKDPEDGNIYYWWNEPDSNNPMTSTELILHRIFQERGFDPVNRLLNLPEETYSDDLRKLDLTDDDAMEWGRLFSSDVVILGKSEITEDERVFVSLKTIDIEKNNVISEDFQIEPIEQSGMKDRQVMDTLEIAINNIVTRLSPAIIKSFEEIEREISLFEVEFRGLRSLKQLQILTDSLKSDINGVKSVIQKRIKRNSITVSVEFAGDVDMFLDRVKKYAKFPFLIDVSKTEEGKGIIEIR